MIDFEDVIKDELSKNKDHYLELINPLKLSFKLNVLDETNYLFYDEIIRQYEKAIVTNITFDMHKRLNLPIDELLSVLGNADLLNFFGE